MPLKYIYIIIFSPCYSFTMPNCFFFLQSLANSFASDSYRSNTSQLKGREGGLEHPEDHEDQGLIYCGKCASKSPHAFKFFLDRDTSI